jgi:DNA-nicking Smr family endonuclease
MSERRRRRRPLTVAEQALWRHVATSVKPLPGKPDFLAPLDELRDSTIVAAPDAPVEMKVPAFPGVPVAPFLPPYQADTQKRGAPGSGLDAGTRRKLAKGRLPLAGRIDLHGMTEAAAHLALLGFVARAVEDGQRFVLVITGKGRSSGSDGVLKRALPHWVKLHPLRDQVSAVEPAARGHGGDGAYYLRLRRRNRIK